MSSFKRRTPASALKRTDSQSNSAPSLNSFPSTSQPSLLSGLHSLDDLLGLNGLPRGHTLLVRTPDPHSAWGLMLSRYFVAQGLVSGDAVLIVAQEDDANELVDGCMWTNEVSDAGSTDAEDTSLEMEPEGDVKIAWRYSRMKQFSTTVPRRVTNQFGAHSESATFDLTMQIPSAMIAHCRQIGQLTTVSPPELSDSNASTHTALLTQIQRLTQEVNSDSTSSRAIRIVIPELGNTPWGDLQPHDITRFLLGLRSLLRGTQAAAFVTLCSALSNDSWGGSGWTGKLAHLSDGCITFAGFGDDPTAHLAFPTHHGLVKVLSSPSPGTLRAPSITKSILRGMNSSGPHGGGENNLAFRCTRKRLIVETMHLGAEGGVGARQTSTSAPDATILQTEIKVQSPKSELARVSVALEVEEHTIPDEESVQKKEKKSRRVVFQSDKPEIYDF